MDRCDHEEAGIRIVVHVRHAIQNGANAVLLRPADTDVVVILNGELTNLQSSIINRNLQIWVGFGIEKHYRVLSINRIFG